MTPTRIQSLALVALGCAVAAWLVTRLVYASLPPLPWTPVPALLLLAAGESWTGWVLRGRLAGKRPGHPVDPIAVARTAALAKASSLAAAFIGGLATGFLVYVLESLAKPAYRSDAYTSGATLASALALAAAALYLEYGCRVPHTDDEPDGPAGPGG